MGKKDKKNAVSKKALKAEKALKAQNKGASKQKKKASKLAANDEDADDANIDDILAEYAKEQANFLAVKIVPCDRPSKRLNPTLVASPPQHGRKELFLFGGESVNNAGLAEFYNDLFIYNVDTNIWRQVTSPNTPLPRSGHAMCVHPSSGMIVLFGGEFSSPKQNTFYHYGDTWILDASTREWTRLELKKGPSARSGHRLTPWRNYVLLHGGFRDLAASTTYLGDLWAFDITTMKWTQLEFPPNSLKPEPRSGHSFVTTEEGAVVWGGYSKVKNSQKKIVGKVHSDTWMLKLSPDLKTIRWERRRKSAWAPSPRVGCSMVYHKGRGVLFGGVYDTQETEETLDSVFYNDLYAYQINTNKWFPLTLRPPRKRPVAAERPVKNKSNELEENLKLLLNGPGSDGKDANDESQDISMNDSDSDDSDEEVTKVEHPITLALPHSRFNCSTAVMQDTIYIYGGMWEKGDREFALDSMYSIDLGKLDGVRVIWETFVDEVARAEAEDDESEEDYDDEDDEDDDDEDDEEVEEANAEEAPEEMAVDEAEELTEAAGGMAVVEPDPRPYLPHPRPFESLRVFYNRTGSAFMEWAISNNKDTGKRGKDLKRDAFELCEERWWERREQIRAAEDQYEELGGIGEIVEREQKTGSGRRR
ncbi:hypothetical protein BZA70DRAFT_39546 [Myxozyma melibiosi]|uniref:DUF4110 domain-containing protein n=1 Tax=Myxozyma melibiosi TaxID=54550 RepID=A0ABR1FED9_9ASCO